MERIETTIEKSKEVVQIRIEDFDNEFVFAWTDEKF